MVVRVQGKLHELPFNLPGERGTFRIAGPVSGVQMQYVPQHLQPAGQASWPALEGLSGELIFEGAGMRVRGGAARVQGHPGWRFDGIEAEIADAVHHRRGAPALQLRHRLRAEAGTADDGTVKPALAMMPAPSPLTI